jgi:hypothetical protein
MAYAKGLVGFALEILDDGVTSGYYSASDIRTLRNVIIAKGSGCHPEVDIISDDTARPHDSQ